LKFGQHLLGLYEVFALLVCFSVFLVEPVLKFGQHLLGPSQQFDISVCFSLSVMQLIPKNNRLLIGLAEAAVALLGIFALFLQSALKCGFART
jgi:hypothetical protein